VELEAEFHKKFYEAIKDWWSIWFIA
jgi:hypothetical protein